jgi:sulfur-oxidizing protein SoxZ
MNPTGKLKAKIKQNIVKAKLLINNPMLTAEEAQRKGVEQDYVVDIVAYVGEREVFHFVPTEWISRNPIFKFKFKQIDVDIGDTLTVRWKTLRGKTETVSCKIK